MYFDLRISTMFFVTSAQLRGAENYCWWVCCRDNEITKILGWNYKKFCSSDFSKITRFFLRKLVRQFFQEYIWGCFSVGPVEFLRADLVHEHFFGTVLELQKFL